jgi:hypothetical protein
MQRLVNDDSSNFQVEQPKKDNCLLEQQRKTIAKLEKSYFRIERTSKRKTFKKVPELSAIGKQYIGTDFDTYKHLKRQDVALLQQLEQKKNQEKLKVAFDVEQAEKNRILALKTEKNRKKRQKRKGVKEAKTNSDEEPEMNERAN